MCCCGVFDMLNEGRKLKPRIILGAAAPTNVSGRCESAGVNHQVSHGELPKQTSLPTV